MPGIQEYGSFFFLAEEEARHLRILANLFREYHKTGAVASRSAGKLRKIAEEILIDKVKMQISAASYEAAAIYAAMGFRGTGDVFFH